jgi:Cytochrome P460
VTAGRQASESTGAGLSGVRGYLALGLAVSLALLAIWARVNRYSQPPKPAKLTVETLESFGGIGMDLHPDTGVPLGFKRIELDRPPSDEFDGLVCASYDTERWPNRFLIVSERAVEQLAAGQRVFPVGTVIYKSYYSKARGRTVIAVMRKREPGFDSEHHDWSYLLGETFQAYEVGRVARCAACHSRAASQDYVFTRTH